MEVTYTGATSLGPRGEEAAAVTVTVDPPTCVVRTKSDQIVLDALANPVSNVKSVELRHFDLDQLSVQQLDLLFGGCGHECQSVSLEKCTLSGDRFFAMMTDQLTRNRVKLVHFRVRSCQQVSMTSLIAISALFTSSLVTLELSSCKLPRQAGIILSQSLQSCTSLRHLLLADNNIRDGGLRAIADALKLLIVSSGSAMSIVLGKLNDSAPSMLEQLDISRNGITSAGFATLTQLPLRRLSAAGNVIESGVGALLMDNTSMMETLCVLGNPLSEDGKLELHIDVEYIVSKTIECMSHNFEQRLGQFLSRMETQQQERNSSQVQFLAAKLEACERALPRLEARLDMLTDRVAAGNAQLAKLQADVALQIQQIRQEVLTQHMSSPYNSTQLSPTSSLSSRMQSQVEEMVSSKVQASEQRLYSEVDRVRAAQSNVTPTDPHAVVNAVSVHLTQFKREFDANQAAVLRQFTESVSSDGRRLEERIAQVEAQIGSLESVIQSEQQASLLALEAISDAFHDPATPVSTRKA
ncbi:uncharacterized protein IUM83_03495 [Phytophthora cinnamomi]|uniref:uncharacterized protein n=1 Tax=Phytophthora cinnamomi TaxID=4785 RepID=UPI00355A1744|nr:hypothetical protein IUM83_03495 [Phytophthora cinnamomi]